MALSPILTAKSFFIVPGPFPASLSFQSVSVVHVIVVEVVVVIVVAVVVAVSGPVVVKQEDGQSPESSPKEVLSKTPT